jgi:hypothetical protein
MFFEKIFKRKFISLIIQIFFVSFTKIWVIFFFLTKQVFKNTEYIKKNRNLFCLLFYLMLNQNTKKLARFREFFICSVASLGLRVSS